MLAPTPLTMPHHTLPRVCLAHPDCLETPPGDSAPPRHDCAPDIEPTHTLQPAVASLRSHGRCPPLLLAPPHRLVDGEAVDGSVPAREYVRTDGSPALLELLLPMELEVRIH